jgi:hypothetical protein
VLGLVTKNKFSCRHNAPLDWKSTSAMPTVFIEGRLPSGKQQAWRDYYLYIGGEGLQFDEHYFG